jgi:hypothetical protein
LVTVGLFAVLFGFLRMSDAPLVAYVPCALFCLAIPLGQVFLYEGRQPRRASCLVGARLLPLLYIGALAVFRFQDLVREFRYHESEFVVVALTLVIFLTASGYLLGYCIGTLSAGVFLVVDRRWDAGKRADGVSKGAESCGASVTATSRIPPTGKWWLDWIAWSPVLWFWQNRRRPVRIAIVLTVLSSSLYLLGILFLGGSRLPHAYLLGAGVLMPLIGLTLSGLLVAGWRAMVVCCPLGIAAVAYPLYRLTAESWVCKSLLPNVSAVEMTLCTSILVGLIAAGISGWIRWTLTRRAESPDRRRLGQVVVAGFIALIILLGLSIQLIADSQRQQFVSLGLVREGTAQGEIEVFARLRTGEELELVVSEESIGKQGRAIARLQNLKELALIDCDIPKGSMEELKSLFQLTELCLAGCHVTDDDMQFLAHLPLLNYLDLSGTSVSDASLKHVAAVPHLDRLWLSRTNVAGAGLAHLKNLQRLTFLGLDDTPVDDEGLSHLPPLPALERLNLSGTRVTGAGLGQMKDMPSLIWLDLDDTPVDDEGLSHLPPLPTLQGLYLSGTHVTGDCLAHIKRLPALNELDLSECDIQDEDLKLLYNFPITWLYVTGASDQAWQALEDAWRSLEDDAGKPPDDGPDPPSNEARGSGVFFDQRSQRCQNTFSKKTPDPVCAGLLSGLR